MGTNYFGWQRTQSGPSIQETLERACERILQEKCPTEAASRTDRGVHAKGQIVQFYMTKEMPPEKLKRALNGTLPSDIRVLEVAFLDFHPTLDAKMKTYHYEMCLGLVQNPFYRHLSWHYPYPVNVSLMEKAAAELTGRKDFRAFTTESRKNPICTLAQIQIQSLENNRLRIAITGNRFLYKMARTIAGTLANIGSGKINLSFAERAKTGVTAPSHGLTLYKVYY